MIIITVIVPLLMLGTLIFQNFKEKKEKNDVNTFFEKYIDNSLSDNDVIRKIKEIADINSIPIKDKKIAHMLLKQHIKSNTQEIISKTELIIYICVIIGVLVLSTFFFIYFTFIK